MPERGFDTGFWGDPFIQSLTKDGKFLFAYLWTNPHCNQAGVYEITTKTISFDTGIPEESLPALLKALEPKANWYPDDNVIWVKNFVKRQSKSPMFLAAAAKCLTQLHNNGLVQEVLQYNLDHYGISIPYEQYSKSISVLSEHNTDRKQILPTSASASGTVLKRRSSSLSFGSFLSLLGNLPGWEVNVAEDIAWLKRVAKEFPELREPDINACGDYYSGRGHPKHKGVWKNRLRNWMVRKAEFARDSARSVDPKKYTQGRYGHVVKT